MATPVLFTCTPGMGKLPWVGVARVRVVWMQRHVQLSVGACRKGLVGVFLSRGGARNPDRGTQ
eukprot:5550948-Prorocentrum_lima.AAC.1